MPGVTPEMVDWWFDWHPRDAVRSASGTRRRIASNSAASPLRSPGKAHWGAVHHPVEDIGTGVVHARIAFCRPSELGFSSDALDMPRGRDDRLRHAGDDTRAASPSTVMVHVFLRDGDGLLLRSRFWIGAAIRPYGPLGPLVRSLLNNRCSRGVTMPPKAARARWPITARRSTRTSRRSCRSCYVRFGPGARSGSGGGASARDARDGLGGVS